MINSYQLVIILISYVIEKNPKIAYKRQINEKDRGDPFLR
jgi:hypothetical protein